MAVLTTVSVTGADTSSACLLLLCASMHVNKPPNVPFSLSVLTVLAHTALLQEEIVSERPCCLHAGLCNVGPFAVPASQWGHV